MDYYSNRSYQRNSSWVGSRQSNQVCLYRMCTIWLIGIRMLRWILRNLGHHWYISTDMIMAQRQTQEFYSIVDLGIRNLQDIGLLCLVFHCMDNFLRRSINICPFFQQCISYLRQYNYLNIFVDHLSLHSFQSGNKNIQLRRTLVKTLNYFLKID